MVLENPGAVAATNESVGVAGAARVGYPCGVRRSWLIAALALTVAPGCGAAAPPPETLVPARVEPEPTIATVGEVVTSAGLAWLVLCAPARLASVEWLRPTIGRLLRDERLDLLQLTTGIDLRAAPELALAGYASAARGDDEEVVLYVVRHRADALAIERKFRERLTSDETRHLHGSHLVEWSGRIGRKTRAFGALGREVAAFQYGGDPGRGPLRAALLYAGGRLGRVPAVLADPTLAMMNARLGTAPLRALMPGPFEGPTARGARGLLGAATGLGAGLTPTEARTLRLEVLIAGDFRADPERAQRLLLAAWQDLATSDLGHLLGLHEPRVAPAASLGELGPAPGAPRAPTAALASKAAATPPEPLEQALALVVELDAESLARGLTAATTDTVREIMQ
jgi:hypothetical protein